MPDLKKAAQNLSELTSSKKEVTAQDTSIIEYFCYHGDLQEGKICVSAKDAVEYLQSLYTQHTEDLQRAFFNPELMDGILAYEKGTYPYLGLYVEAAAPHVQNSYGVVGKPGFYGITITQPSLFSNYLLEQLESLEEFHEVVFVVGHSRRMIPVSFLKENVLHQVEDFAAIKPLLVLPSLHDIDDEIVNSILDWDLLPVKPLGFFPAERTDYSLSRLKHYCGTSAEHFQNYVLLTNYQRYIDGFFQYAKDPARQEEGYTHWVEPQDQCFPIESLESCYHRELGHNFQMPAYHLKREDGNGITLINIGVGPSNTKTITDHLAVLRSHCWLMLGHCGGLHHTQRLGDYVLANSYMREDRVLDDELPLHIPIPPIAEVQQAIMEAARTVMDEAEIKRCIRSGTVMSTGNRNWELRVKEFSRLINLSRSLAVDMESATLAANAFRFCIPYGTLLCVSDRPLHGELKLHGPARTFYQQRVSQHLMMGLKTMELLRQGPSRSVHSRKLRGFQTIPFR